MLQIGVFVLLFMDCFRMLQIDVFILLMRNFLMPRNAFFLLLGDAVEEQKMRLFSEFFFCEKLVVEKIVHLIGKNLSECFFSVLVSMIIGIFSSILVGMVVGIFLVKRVPVEWFVVLFWWLQEVPFHGVIAHAAVHVSTCNASPLNARAGIDLILTNRAHCIVVEASLPCASRYVVATSWADCRHLSLIRQQNKLEPKWLR